MKNGFKLRLWQDGKEIFCVKEKNIKKTKAKLEKFSMKFN